MLYEAVGENLKKIDKITNGSFLPRYPGVHWKGAMKFRDVIAHHYFEINSEALFVICQKYLPGLSKTVKKIIDDFKPHEHQ